MTTAADLFELAYQQLTPTDKLEAPTSAEDRVRRPGDLPTQSDAYPNIDMRLISETKQSTGRGSIGFTTTATIRFTGKVSAPANIEEPLTSDIEVRLWTLKREIERAIINSYPLFSVVQQLVSVQSQLAYDAAATHLAGIQSDYTFEFYESAEDFAPLPVDDLTQIVATDANHPGAGFTADFAA